jgi:thymidylate synthase
MWNQRSVDTFLGLPFNIASYGFLLEMIAQQVNMVPDKLIGSLGDTHIYSNHIPFVKELLERDPNWYPLPKLKLKKAEDIFSYKISDFEITEYTSYPNWKDVPLSN